MAMPAATRTRQAAALLKRRRGSPAKQSESSRVSIGRRPVAKWASLLKHVCGRLGAAALARAWELAVSRESPVDVELTVDKKKEDVLVHDQTRGDLAKQQVKLL